MKGCIVGLGSIGSRHLKNLEFLGVRDLVVLRRHGNPAYTTTHPVVSSHAEALAAKPDFAVICSPTSMHASDALPFLQAGVPTLIEKPLAAPGEYRGEFLDSHPAFMAYSLRYHPAYRKARDLLVSKKIGRPLYAKLWNECYLPDWHPNEDYRQSYAAREDLGGGLPHTLDHEVDFANWCFGCPLLQRGFSCNTNSIGVSANDLTALSVVYNGVLCAVTLSMCRRKKSRGFEIVTDWGVLSYDWSVGLLRFHATEDTDDMHAKTFCQCGNYDINQMYVDLMEDFMRRLEGQVSDIPYWWAGRYAMDAYGCFEEVSNA